MPLPPPSARIDAHPLVFTGTGVAYARIWALNLLLIGLSLGLLWPLARWRTRRYLLGHTVMAGLPLVDTTPWWPAQLAWGGLWATVAALRWTPRAAELAVPVGGLGLGLVLALLALALLALGPWAGLWLRARRLGGTTWHGLRRQDLARLADGYRASRPLALAVLLWGALLGAAPEWVWRTPVDDTQALAALGLIGVTGVLGLQGVYNWWRLGVQRAGVGGQRGYWGLPLAPLLGVAAGGLAWLLGGLGLAALALAEGRGLAAGWGLAWPEGVGGSLLAALVTLAVLVLVTVPARAWWAGRGFRLYWSHVGLGELARLRSSLAFGPYLRLRLVNAALSLVTLGLYRPFARVSDYAMRAESLTLFVKGGVDAMATLLAQAQAQLDALAAAPQAPAPAPTAEALPALPAPPGAVHAGDRPPPPADVASA